jgi:hypothetical protein
MSGQENIPKIIMSSNVPAMKGIIHNPNNTVKKSGKTVAFRDI